MTELTAEKLKELQQLGEYLRHGLMPTWEEIRTLGNALPALLDAAEERDRLRDAIGDAVESRAAISRLEERTESAERELEKALKLEPPLEGGHADPESCRTWHDGCNCTLSVLEYNIDRAESAERERDEGQRAGEILFEALDLKCEKPEKLAVPVLAMAAATRLREAERDARVLRAVKGDLQSMDANNEAADQGHTYHCELTPLDVLQMIEKVEAREQEEREGGGD